MAEAEKRDKQRERDRRQKLTKTDKQRERENWRRQRKTEKVHGLQNKPAAQYAKAAIA